MKSVKFAAILCLIALSVRPLQATDAAEPIDYLKQVKPILTAACYECHGPQEHESGLRLDSVAWALEGGNRGPAIVPGKSADSRLMQALTGIKDVPQMPPKDAGDPLKPEQIAVLKAWIDQGAKTPVEEKPPVTAKAKSDHWAFRPIVVHAPPAVKNQAWVRNPIDRYILARLESQGIAPSPEAEPATLIRRLYIDLVGLPPTPEEVQTFVQQFSASPRLPVPASGTQDAETRRHGDAENAYEALVDRILSSPHYGERWGRHWLDAARYADSNGYTIDGSRSIWKYRDWVIGAINRDMPFDQFTIEQIAGDMLPEATTEQIIATGFHRNTLKNEEGGTDQEQFRVEAVADRVETTGSVFLGLTVGCARCHDHKYDPLSQREFYQLFAVFNNADEPAIQLPTDQQSKELPALKSEIAAALKRQADVGDSSGSRQKEWEKRLEGKLDVKWVPLDAEEFRSAGGAALTKLEDKSLLVSGKIPGQDTYTIAADLPAQGVTAIRLEALTDESLPRHGPGLADGAFTLSELAVKARPLAAGSGSADEMPVAFGEAVTDEENEKNPVENVLDGDPKTGWTVMPAKDALGKDQSAIFVTKDDLGAGGPIRLTFTLSHKARQAQQALGRFRLSVTTDSRDAVVVSDEARKILAIPPEERTDEQKKLAHEAFHKVDEEVVAIVAQVKLLKQREKQLNQSVTTTLVMRERPTPRETHIHVRGDFLRPGAVVKPAVPAVLPPLASQGRTPNRLDFARWLVDAKNPLTPRVMVNRYWQEFFGRGIVETDNDFGLQGSRPTHGELLDYLAAQFMAPASGYPGWSMRAVHRLIVTSAAYRQASHARPELRDKDPENKLLARQSRLRLSAETVRDVALTAAGLLTPEIGGPGVYPPQPEGVYRFTQVAKYWAESQGPDRYRRGMYTYFWRSRPYPFLSTFDAPDGNVTCTRRLRSNTPLQALTLSNDKVFLEAAQGLAARVLQDGGEGPGVKGQESGVKNQERARHAFKLCLAREPNDVETTRLLSFLDVQRQRFEQATEEAARVAPSMLPAGVTVVDAAAWTATARVLMNLDEFITRE